MNDERLTTETPEAAMKRLSIGRAKLYEHINAGRIQSYLDGGRRKIISQSIDAFMQQRLAEEEAKRQRRAA